MSTTVPLVLIVSADQTLAGRYTHLLTDAGIGSIHCEGGRNALQMALDHKPHLILLDAEVTQSSGFDLLEIIRGTPETDHTKVLLISPIVTPDSRKRVRELGAIDLVVNAPGTMKSVVSLIRKQLV